VLFLPRPPFSYPDPKGEAKGAFLLLDQNLKVKVGGAVRAVASLWCWGVWVQAPVMCAGCLLIAFHC
jgi:hypothetical protein